MLCALAGLTIVLLGAQRVGVLPDRRGVRRRSPAARRGWPRPGAQPRDVRAEPDRGARHGVPRRSHAGRRDRVRDRALRSWRGPSAARRSWSASGWGSWRSAAASWPSPASPSSSSSGPRSATGRRSRCSGSRCSRRRPRCCSRWDSCCPPSISPMASGIVAVGLFGATWIAGVVGGIGEALDNEGVARVGTVSRMLLPTDGLWRGAMHAFQDPTAAGPVRRGLRGPPVPEPVRAHGRLRPVGRRLGRPHPRPGGLAFLRRDL